MQRRRLGWVFLTLALCACALGPLAATSSAAGEIGVKLDYAPRQDFVGNDSVRIEVRSSMVGTVAASGNLEIGSAAKKTYGRNLWPIAGVSAPVKAGGTVVLRMHIPKNVQRKARRALATGRKAIVRVSIGVTGRSGEQGKAVAVIGPTG